MKSRVWRRRARIHRHECGIDIYSGGACVHAAFACAPLSRPWLAVPFAAGSGGLVLAAETAAAAAAVTAAAVAVAVGAAAADAVAV